MAESLTVVPAARRLMESLRDIGYTLPSAIADLVDNSIDAGAHRIDVTLHFDGSQSWIRVSDDGCGMTPSRLDEAMRYGSRREYRERELGKFGLGLKTASLSQCRILTVAARRSSEHRRIHIRRWSLDHIAVSDRWDLLRLTPTECRAEVTEPLRNGRGTVILWEALDRILRYRRPDGGAAENGLAALSIQVSEHLGMVFHRFLGNQSGRRRRLRIFVNDAPVAAWDPFARDQPATRTLTPQSMMLTTAGGRSAVQIAPFILPREDRFSDRAAHCRAAGPRRWNRQQGLYIYRAGRLIQSGGWNRLRAEDEHTKLARIAVDIPHGCDELFEINVSKMRVSLPAELRAPLKTIVTGVAAEAEQAYRRSKPPLPTGDVVSGAEPYSPVIRLADSPRFEAAQSSPPMFDSRLGVHWEQIEEVLVHELAGDPELLSRLLRRLRQEARLDPILIEPPAVKAASGNRGVGGAIG